ncbi:MAG TPA: septal ring lytic transglycosylase RlpA family protein [Desulfobulbus sp.]|nr:septal ring lytic transglycosylase RlpA family protein [Desulfobulbus sp.]
MNSGCFRLLLAGLLASLLVTACTSGRGPVPEKEPAAIRPTQRAYTIGGRRYYPIPSAEGYRETGVASWYGGRFHGRPTASGERYDMHDHTAAHKTLPMGTVLLVRNLDNGRTTVVRINDRGPFVRNRIIDLSYRAARELGMIRNGTARVEIVAMGEQEKREGTAGNEKRPRLKHRDFDKGRFYVQVGSFVDLEKARRLARKFAARGRDVVIQQFPAAGISLYRVMVYSGTSLAGAKQDEKRLESSGFPNALVIAR